MPWNHICIFFLFSRRKKNQPLTNPRIDLSAPTYEITSTGSTTLVRPAETATLDNETIHVYQTFESDPEVIPSNDDIYHNIHVQCEDNSYAYVDDTTEPYVGDMNSTTKIYAEAEEGMHFDAAINSHEGWADNHIYSSSNSETEEDGEAGWMDNSIYDISDNDDNDIRHT